jgi:hypothetical protein
MKLSATEYTLIGLVLVLTSFVNIALFVFFWYFSQYGSALQFFALIGPIFYLIRGALYICKNIADIDPSTL